MKFKKRVINSQKELKLISELPLKIIVKAKYGPSQETQIPLELGEELSFLSALIIGDGHLKKSKFQISFECTNRDLVIFLRTICKRLFNREFNINDVKLRPLKKQSFHMCIDSKAIYNLLNLVFEIPIGKKSDIVKIPLIILNSKDESIKAAFILGIMATEGGNRRRGLGLSSASKELRDNTMTTLESMGIKVLTDEWTNSKYNKKYYGLVYKKDLFRGIIEKCNNRDIRNIISKCNNL